MVPLIFIVEIKDLLRHIFIRSSFSTFIVGDGRFENVKNRVSFSPERVVSR